MSLRTFMYWVFNSIEYDSWEKTWFIKEVVDSEKLGSSDRIQRKALQSQMYVSLKPNDPLKEEEKKEAGT